MGLNIKIKKIADVKTPHYAHKGDSGVDLYAAANGKEAGSNRNNDFHSFWL